MKNIANNILKCLAVVLAVSFVAACSDSDDSLSFIPPKAKKTTLLMYIEGTTYEHPEIANVFFQGKAEVGLKPEALGYTPANFMIKGMTDYINDEDVNIIVQTGSYNDGLTFSDSDITSYDAEPSKFFVKDWGSVTRWKATKNNFEATEILGKSCTKSVKENCIPLNTAETISSFIEYGIRTAPADRYVIVFFSHGGGNFGFGEPSTSAAEMRKAFQTASDNVFAQTGKRVSFDVIGFAACLMASAEIVYNLADFGKYYVGSQEVEVDYPWLIDELVKSISANDSTEELLEVITDSYMKYSAMDGVFTDPYETVKTNISAIDLNEVKTLNDRLNDFSKAVLANFAIEPAKTFNGIMSARAITQEFGGLLSIEGASKVNKYDQIDIKHFMENIEKQTTFYQDYNIFTNSIKDSLTAAVKINKYSVWFNDHANGIAAYFPYDQFAKGVDTADFVNKYAERAGIFGTEYSKMMKELVSYAKSKPTENSVTASPYQDGTEIKMSLESNFAVTTAELTLVKPDENGILRQGTVAGIYNIESTPVNSEKTRYDISIGTMDTNPKDAYLFCIAKTGSEICNPIKVKLFQNKLTGLENSYGFSTRVLYQAHDSLERRDLDIYGVYSFNPATGEHTAEMKSYNLVVEQSLPSQQVELKAGDKIIIPEATLDTKAKADITELPDYEILCANSNDEECFDIYVDSFETDTELKDIKFVFDLKNVKAEYYHYEYILLQ